MTSEDLSALAEKYKKIIHEFGYASSDNGEDVKAYFVKETLIDLLYGGNWHQCDQVIQYSSFPVFLNCSRESREVPEFIVPTLIEKNTNFFG